MGCQVNPWCYHMCYPISLELYPKNCAKTTPIKLSINGQYYCYFSCKFCYSILYHFIHNNNMIQLFYQFSGCGRSTQRGGFDCWGSQAGAEACHWRTSQGRLEPVYIRCREDQRAAFRGILYKSFLSYRNKVLLYLVWVPKQFYVRAICGALLSTTHSGAPLTPTQKQPRHSYYSYVISSECSDCQYNGNLYCKRAH